MSCLITRQHFERVDGFVRRALAAGAQPILGGSPNDELGHLYYRPTILVDAEPGSEILTEEVFGPVLTIQTFSSEEQAVEMANNTRFGLAATLVTGDPDRAERVSAQINAGPSGSTVSSYATSAHRSAATEGPASVARAASLVRLLLRHQEHRVLPDRLDDNGLAPARSRIRQAIHSERNMIMGEVVGAGLIAHVPTIVLPEATRRELNNGKDTTLVAGLEQLRQEVFDTLDYDTVVVLDSHWATTVEFVVTAQERRQGLFTSEELPRGMTQRPYEFRGDPDLAHLIASKADDHQTWITAISDDHLPIFYATTNLWEFLGQGLPDKRWISIGVCQTG